MFTNIILNFKLIVVFIYSEKLGNEDDDKVSVLSDLESILTYHRKTLGPSSRYIRGNGWIELLIPLIALKLPRDQTCALFQVLIVFISMILAYFLISPICCSYVDTDEFPTSKIWFVNIKKHKPE